MLPMTEAEKQTLKDLQNKQNRTPQEEAQRVELEKKEDAGENKPFNR